MADGRSIGTIFAELDLDPSRYTKGQQQLYKDATQTALGIEENFKKLGIKSSAEFDLMRQKATNSLNGILNHSKATANDIYRAQQAHTAQMQRLNEQQFGHQTTLIEGLKKNWIAASVAIGAAMVVVNKAIALMDEGAKALQVESSFKILAEAAGTSSEKMIASMKAATKETIDDSDLMQKAIKLLTLSYNPDQIERFSKVIITASQYAGTTAVDAYEGLADAIANRMPKALVRYGAVTKDQMEIVNKAINNGADSAMLFELAIANLSVKQLQLQGTQDSATLAMQRFHAQVNDTKEAIGKGLIVVAQRLYGVLQAVSAAALGTGGALFSLISHLPGTDKARWQAESKAAYGAAEALANQSYGNMYGTADAGSKASKSAIDTEKQHRDAIMKTFEAFAKKGEASKDSDKAAREAQRLHEFLVDLYIKDEAKKWEELEKYEQDYLAESEKMMSDYLSMMKKEHLESLNPIEKIKEAEKEKFDFIKSLQERRLLSEEEAAKARILIEQNSAKEIQEINQKLLKERLGQISDGFGALQSACLDIASVYAEGSESAKKWEEAARAMEIAQRAVVVVQAVSAIATQGLGDPYTAFVRIAAMAAAMGALLASIGESVGGSVSSAAPVSSFKSTALGSEEASNSVSNSLELLKNIYDIENVKLTKIYEEVRDLNNNTTGLITSIVRTGGISSASSFGVIEGYDRGGVQSQFDKVVGQSFPKFDYLSNIVTGWVSSVIGSIFGGGTETTVSESGIEIGKVIVKSIINGASVSARQYVSGVTVTEGGMFEGDDTYGFTNYQALDSSVTKMLTLVYKNISESLVTIAGQLGADTQKVLAYEFENVQLNLKDMTSSEMNTAMQEYISTIADTAAEALFGDLISQYQKLNEGLLETAVRLISDKETIARILELTNQTFNGTASQFIKFSESLITVAGSLDVLTDAFSTYYDAFFSDAEKQADYKQTLMNAMAAYGLSLPTTRAGYRNIVESQDLETAAGQSAYYAMLALSSTADKYYDYLENAAKTAAGNINPANYSTNLEYQRALAGLPKYADGGIASGPMTGYAATLHGTELVISPRKSYPATVKGESYAELLAEVKALREEVANGNRNITTNTSKIANNTEYLETWDTQGLPS